MKRLDIRLAAQYSGIKAHTIRVWEQRYDLLKPKKGAGNRREYTREDITVLMNIALLTKYGYSISKLAKLPEERIKEITSQLSSSAAGSDIYINKLLTCHLRTDIFNFENTINEFANKKGLHASIIELIVPFIERAELFSHIDQNASSHFTINLARKKIIAATEEIKPPETNKGTVVMFLPPSQYFDLILLYLSYQLQYKGYRVIYLGGNCSNASVTEIITKYKTDALVTYTSPREKTNPGELQQFSMEFSNSGRLFIATAEKDNTNYMEVLDELISNTLQVC